MEKIKIKIGESFKTAFSNDAGVFQDGTVPLYRDVDGKLWGIGGHSHMGHIGMFCGTNLKDMKYMYLQAQHAQVISHSQVMCLRQWDLIKNGLTEL